MGPEERTTAISQPPSCYQVAVEAGYPLLRAEGARLKADGVPFTDPVDPFIDEPRPMYKDACCHFTHAGYQAIARAIAQAIPYAA